MVQELRSIRTLQETQGQTVERLVKQLRTELIEPVVGRLDQSAQLTKEASLAVRELKDELGGVTQSLAGAVETIQSFQQDTLVQLQQFASNLQSILAQFRNDTQGVMEQVAAEIHQAVEQSIAGMEAQRTAFEASANQAATTFRGIREDLQAALETQAGQQKQMLQEVRSSTEAILVRTTEAFENQSTTLTAVGREATELMSQAKENLLGTLSNIDGMLQNTRQTVQEELERFRLGYQSALQDFFVEQNNLLNETLGQQREGLAQVVANLQQTFNEEAVKRQQMTAQVDQSLAKMQETVGAVNKLASAVGMNSSERLAQLQELARTIGKEAQRVEETYQSMTNQFDDALRIGNEQLMNYLQQANESYSKSFIEADKATAQVCNQLNNTANGINYTANELIKAAHCFVAARDDFENGNGNRLVTTANDHHNGNGSKG